MPIDLGIVSAVLVTITTLIIFQLKRFNDSKKPKKQTTAFFNVSPENYTNAELEENDTELEKSYHKEILTYYSGYLFPIIIALPSYFIFINLAIGLSFFIAGLIAIVLSVIVTKN